ncbi:hypothetical protein V1517DRAFT_140982 [Lipomyces orientalis]|uniref:Uncharacterized protein n=1 Tax=Lipomyces orientalis TaxID=1233043 RepID=A0ACC3TQ75_9ASCO
MHFTSSYSPKLQKYGKRGNTVCHKERGGIKKRLIVYAFCFFFPVIDHSRALLSNQYRHRRRLNPGIKMIPASLVSIYQRYKQDTDSVASWLASTAKACGYPADLLASKSWDVPPPKSGRLKGKARKDAQAAGTAGSRKASKYIVALKDFLPLARFIAQYREPGVSVPDSFSTIINRLITTRSEFGKLMDDHGAKPDPEADQKHSYFVGILEAVREAVRPRMTTPAATATAEAATEAKAAESGDDAMAKLVTNRFAVLSVEEPSQAFIEPFLNAPPERPKPRDDDPIVYEAEAPKSLEDIMFSFTVMVNDLNRIRSRIQWIWSSHRDGLFDLAASAVATNTAISLARGLIEDIVPLFDAHEEGAWGITNKLFAMCCLTKGYTVDEIYLDGEDNFNYDLYKIADDVYLVSYRMLLSFLDVLDPRELPLIKEGMFGRYDPDSDPATKTGRQKYQEDRILLMEFFSELMTVIRCVPGYPVEDEFLRGMKELDKTRTVSFSLVFAAQIFLDIHHTMRTRVRLSFSTMVEQTTMMDNSLNSYLKFHEKLKIENWPAANDHVVRELSRMMKWIGSDPVHQAKAKVYHKQGMPVPSSMEAHRIMIFSPVLSGLYLFRVRGEIFNVGIAIANAWGSIAYCAHLYNALEQEKLLIGSWPDMDVVLTLLGDLSFWVGERPRTAEDYYKKFCLQMGVSAATFMNASKRRRGIVLASRAGPRGIKDGAKVSSMFKIGTANVDWTAERIDDIVARSEYKDEGSSEAGTLIMTQIDDPQELRERTRMQRQKAKANAVGKNTVADSAGFGPEQLVKALVLALHAETLEMAFPYLTMHRFAWMLLRAVKESCDPVLKELYTTRYIEKESELPWVVGHIFMAASGHRGIPDYRPMKSAADALNRMIGDGAGRVSITVARKMGFGIEFEVEEEEAQDGGRSEASRPMDGRDVARAEP